MKVKLFLNAILLCSILNVFGQEKSITKVQMLKDFDELVGHINNFAVHKDLNAERLGIDYDKEYSLLRDQITDHTSYCDFRNILVKTTNLVQDGHCCFMPHSYLNNYGKYQNKLNFKDDHTYEAIKYFEETCGKTPNKLNLPLLYERGNYYVYADFIYKSDTIRRGTEVTAYNGDLISNSIKKNYDKIWPVKWDAHLKSPYHPDFYKSGNKDFLLELFDKKTKTIYFNLEDSVVFLQKMERIIYYGSQSKEQVQYFENHNALYIGLPFMDVSMAESINQKVDSLTDIHSIFSKIIIDIRGNPGGSDVTWRKVLNYLISEKIQFSTDLKYKYNEAVHDYYGKRKRKFPEEKISLLNNASFWTKETQFKSLKPDRKSIHHRGNIYVLQDEYIYSSAGNFSNFCIYSDKLISVGNATDLVGGLQTDPLFIKLSNSGLIFRIEPMLDFSNVSKIDDFSHNSVEVDVVRSAEDVYKKSTYKGDIYGPDFLLNYDQVMQYVLKQ